MFIASGPPQPDTLEVSLFGGGIGESLALHVGEGQWILVDSCRSAGLNSEPISLTYLKSIGVDPSTAVRLIVATHWHDDHVNGLSDLVEQCTGAQLVFSQALANDEFLELVGSFSDQPIGFDYRKSGVREMGQCFSTVFARKGTQHYRPVLKTSADQKIFRSGSCEVVSLSPSPQAIHLSDKEMAATWNDLKNEAVVRAGGPRPSRAGIPCPERNHNAVALWVRWGDRRVLLGADLEERGDPLLGWQAVLDCNQFPDGHARVFKIAHHGSPNGHLDAVWGQIVSNNDAFAILTAYNRGQTPRPTPTDIQRIAAHVNNIHYTSLPKATANRYPRTVERTLDQVVRRRRSLGATPGHVQLRWDTNNLISIEHAGAAGKI